MICESVVCVILHCSRCNAALTSDETDTSAHWASKDQIAGEFHPEGLTDVCGWRRFNDRYICPDCQTFDEETGDPIENPARLPAADADKVARAQASYASFELAMLPRPANAGPASAIVLPRFDVHSIGEKGPGWMVRAAKDGILLIRVTAELPADEARTLASVIATYAEPECAA